MSSYPDASKMLTHSGDTSPSRDHTGKFAKPHARTVAEEAVMTDQPMKPAPIKPRMKIPVNALGRP